MKQTVKIVDAKGQIVGRLCTHLAKQALLGQKIVVINCKDAVISGRKQAIIKENLHLNEIRNFANPKRGPFRPHRPDTFMKHAIRGMLPKSYRGDVAKKLLSFYISEIPLELKEQYKNAEPLQFEGTSAAGLLCDSVTVNDLCVRNGWSQY